MDQLRELAGSQPRLSQEPDRLELFLRSLGGTEGFDALCRGKLRTVDWAKTMDVVTKQAEAIVEKAEAKARKDQAPMDAFIREQVLLMAKREALLRLLQASLEASTDEGAVHSNMDACIASPFSDTARLNQLSNETLKELMTKGVAKQTAFIAKEWVQFASRDLKRLQRSAIFKDFYRLDLKKHIHSVPGLYTVAELLSALPSELNLKARTQFCEIGNSSSFISTATIPSIERSSALVIGTFLMEASGSPMQPIKLNIAGGELAVAQGDIVMFISRKSQNYVSWTPSVPFFGIVSDTAS